MTRLRHSYDHAQRGNHSRASEFRKKSSDSEPLPSYLDELPSDNDNDDDIRLLLGAIELKEKELKLRDQEIEGLNTRLNKATTELTRFRKISSDLEPLPSFLDERPSDNDDDISMLLESIELKENELKLRDQEIEGLKTRLNKDNTELTCAQAKNEEIILNMNYLQDDLEICRNKEAMMTAKIKRLDETTKTADSEITKLKRETKQWRQAAKTIASVLAGGADICSNAPQLEPLVLYYDNRAATRMAVGRMREGLNDSRMAAALDPKFMKANLRSANCHLFLGEVEDAVFNYKKCLESGDNVCLEAADGLQKAQKVVDYLKLSKELLQQKTYDSATNALGIIADALSISRYSEKLLYMKGEALLVLGKHEEVVQPCEQTLSLAEKNFATGGVVGHMNVGGYDCKNSLKIWRWNLMAKSYFHLGRLEIALDLIEEHEQLRPTTDKILGPEESLTHLAVTIREKKAGNEAYEAGRFGEAVEHYSKALQSVESRSFTAICLCNRAAARQALGEVVDAIADCNLAIALDGNYLKAISRRARLYEKIRDYENAAFDLQRLISLLEKQSEAKHVEDLSEARQRLSSVNRYVEKRVTLDLYLILGLKMSESDSEIKRAYRSAALRHHPDKAGKFLARSGHVWKEISTTIHKDADQRFKIIREAYDVLSDAEKRFKYNREDRRDDR